MLETIQKHEGKPWSPSEETSITKYKGKSNCECSSIARGGRQIFGKRQIVDGFSHGNQSVSKGTTQSRHCSTIQTQELHVAVF